MDIQNSLGYLLGVSSRIMKQRIDKLLAIHNLTSSQWAILSTLKNAGSMTQIDLAQSLHSDKATCGAIIELLRKNEYVEKQRNEADKRSFIITLTDKAINVIQMVEDDVHNLNISVEMNFSTDEISALKKSLKKIIEIGETSYELENRNI